MYCGYGTWTQIPLLSPSTSKYQDIWFYDTPRKMLKFCFLFWRKSRTREHLNEMKELDWFTGSSTDNFTDENDEKHTHCGPFIRCILTFLNFNNDIHQNMRSEATIFVALRLSRTTGLTFQSATRNVAFIIQYYLQHIISSYLRKWI